MRALLLVCLMSTQAAAGDRCMIITNDHTTTKLTFDAAGHLQTFGGYTYTWTDGHITRVSNTHGLVATYEYGSHGELLSVASKTKTWAKWTWDGTWGAKRASPVTLYGRPIIDSTTPVAGPIDAREPDALFTGKSVEIGQVTSTYADGIVTSTTYETLTYDAHHHLVKSVRDTGHDAAETETFKYKGDLLVHEDDTLGSDPATSRDYSYDKQGRATKYVQKHGTQVQTWTYNYDCP